MLLRDVVVAAVHPQPVRLEQHVGVRVAGRRLEAVGRELDQQAQRVHRAGDQAGVPGALRRRGEEQERVGAVAAVGFEIVLDLADVGLLARLPDTLSKCQ